MPIATRLRLILPVPLPPRRAMPIATRDWLTPQVLRSRAGYANRNQYDQYHPGMTNGYWNGNYGYGEWGMGGVSWAESGCGAWARAVRLRLLGVQQPILWRRCGAGWPLCTIGGGARLRLLSTN